MTRSSTVHLGVDAALVGLLALVWWSGRRSLKKISADRIAATLNVLEARVTAFEADHDRFRNDAARELGALSRICGEAAGILDRARHAKDAPPPLERGELEEAARLCRGAVSSKVPLDLRTLLNDQLA